LARSCCWSFATLSAGVARDLRGVGGVVRHLGCVGVDVVVRRYSCGRPVMWPASRCRCWWSSVVFAMQVLLSCLHILGFVDFVCSWFWYVRAVRSGAGQRYPVAEGVTSRRKTLLVGRCTHSFALHNPVHATSPTHPPQIPSVLVSVGAGQGEFFVLAGGGVRIRYRRSSTR